MAAPAKIKIAKQKRVRVSEPNCDVQIDRVMMPEDPFPPRPSANSYFIQTNHVKVSEPDVVVCTEVNRVNTKKDTKERHEVSHGDHGYETGMDISVPLDVSAANNHNQTHAQQIEKDSEAEEIMETPLPQVPRSQTPPPVDINVQENVPSEEVLNIGDASPTAQELRPIPDSPEPIIGPTQVTPLKSSASKLPRLQLSSGPSIKGKLKASKSRPTRKAAKKQSPSPKKTTSRITRSKSAPDTDQKFLKSKRSMRKSTEVAKQSEKVEICEKPVSTIDEFPKSKNPKPKAFEKSFEATVSNILKNPQRTYLSKETESDHLQVIPDSIEATGIISDQNIQRVLGSDCQFVQNVEMMEASQEVQMPGKQTLLPTAFYPKKPNPRKISYDPYALDFIDEVPITAFPNKRSQSAHAGNYPDGVGNEYDQFENNSIGKRQDLGVMKTYSKKVPASSYKPQPKVKQTQKATVPGKSVATNPTKKRKTVGKQKTNASENTSAVRRKKAGPQNKEQKSKIKQAKKASKEQKTPQNLRSFMSNSTRFGVSQFMPDCVLSDCSVTLSPLDRRTLKKHLQKKTKPKKLELKKLEPKETPNRSHWLISAMLTMYCPANGLYLCLVCLSCLFQANHPGTRSKTNKSKIASYKANDIRSSKQSQKIQEDCDESMDVSVPQINYNESNNEMSEEEDEPESSRGSEMFNHDVQRGDSLPNVLSSVRDIKKDFMARCADRQKLVAGLTEEPVDKMQDKVLGILNKTKRSREKASADLGNAITREITHLNSQRKSWEKSMKRIMAHVQGESERVKEWYRDQTERKNNLSRIMNDCLNEMSEADDAMMDGLQSVKDEMHQERINMRNSLIKHVQEREMRALRRNMEMQFTTWLT